MKLALYWTQKLHWNDHKSDFHMAHEEIVTHFMRNFRFCCHLTSFCKKCFKKLLASKICQMTAVEILMVFCYQICSDLLWKKMFYWSREKLLKFEIRGWRPKIWNSFEITRTIFSNSERSEQFLVTECFLTCSWRFLISNSRRALEWREHWILTL